MTLICCPLMVQSVERGLADAAVARELGADLVEYRLDEFFTGGQGGHADHADLESEIRSACDLVGRSPLACIATCRPTWEGGQYDGPDDARIALFEAMGTLTPPHAHPPRYIDVELAAYERSANLRQKVHLAVDFHPGSHTGLVRRDLAPGLILSTHDFAGRPADLSRRLMAVRRHDACRVLKVAYRARSLRDNLDLLEILESSDRPAIALGMGEFGLMSRVLAPKFGGLLTFASIRPGEVTAPGQPTIRELLDLYRFRTIGKRTKVYGVVGWPVGHSLSPLVHNAGFEAVGHDGVYLPLPVASAEGCGPEAKDATYASFKASILALMEHPSLDFAGCSVTLPHKENLARLAEELAQRGQAIEIDAQIRLCGAANTLAREVDDAGQPRWRVFNTDAVAARACLESRLGTLEGRRIDVIGAGGVGRTIAAAVATAGAHVRIMARDPEKAHRLVLQLRASIGRCGADVPGDRLTVGSMGELTGPSAAGTPARAAGHQAAPIAHAVVNATPVGMSGGPAPELTPIDVDRLARESPGCIVFDTVYTPMRTPLLTAAEAAGLPTIDGVSMFVRQAEAQFEAWTQALPPQDLFDRLTRQRLGA